MEHLNMPLTHFSRLHDGDDCDYDHGDDGGRDRDGDDHDDGSGVLDPSADPKPPLNADAGELVRPSQSCLLADQSRAEPMVVELPNIPKITIPSSG